MAAQMPIPPKIHDTLLPKADLNVVELCRFLISEAKNSPSNANHASARNSPGQVRQMHGI